MTTAPLPAGEFHYLWRILIVDDEPANLRVAQRFLDDTRYAVSVAGDGQEALSVVAERGVR